MSIAKPLAIYGYNIIVPEEDPLDFIHDIDTFNETLIEPIQVYFITPSLTMTNIGEVQAVIGFIPDHDLRSNMIHLDSLREFIMDNPMFDEIEMDETPGFYTGFIWKDDIDSEEESEVSEEDSDDCESTDHSEDYADSEVSNDYESEDLESEENDKSLSHYIARYYI